MTPSPLNLAGTGGKTGALAELSTLILPVREQALQALLYDDLLPAERSRLLTHVGQLTQHQAELDAHGRALFLAGMACEHGLTGTEPDNWATYRAGELYDAHSAVISALEYAPGHGAGLSPALLTFFDQLPNERREDFTDGMTKTAAEFFIPSLPHLDDSEPHAITPEEIAYHAQGIMTGILEKTLFLGIYADDIRQALTLAKQGGDFAAINRLVE